VFGIAIGTAIFNSKGSLTDPAAVTSGYRPAMVAAAGFSVFGAVVAVAIRRRAAAAGREPVRALPGHAEAAGTRPPDLASVLPPK
jgi:hypothetical protein